MLAAGMGSRFGGLKQVEAVGPRGESLLEYSIYDALEAGFDEIFFLIRSGIEADFRDRVLSRLPRGLRCGLLFQEIDSLVGPDHGPRSKPWGTGHALLCAAGSIDRPFAVVNADDYYGRASLRLVREFLERSEAGSGRWCMAGYRLRNTTTAFGSVARGVCERDGSGRLASIAEQGRIERRGGGRFVAVQGDGAELELDGDRLVSMNLWGLTPAVFGLAEGGFRSFLERSRFSPKDEFYLPALVDGVLLEGRASVDLLETEDEWCGITYREDLPLARARMAALSASGFYPSPLWG